MKKFNIKMEAALFIISIVPMLATLILASRLPENMPIHWNLEGKVDGYGSKWISPLLCIGLYFLLLLIMFIDPKKDNYDKFRSLLYKIRLILTLFFAFITGVIILAGLGEDIKMDRILLIGIPVLFAFLGNTMINIKPNWFIGVRTPWTLESETVWRKTHRLTGRLWFWAGLVLGIVGFIIYPPVGMYIMFAVILIIVIIPIVFSYREYQRESKVINNKASSGGTSEG